MLQRTIPQGQSKSYHRVVTIVVLAYAWRCGDRREGVQVLLLQKCLPPSNRSTKTHVPTTLPDCFPGSWLLVDSRRCSSHDEPTQNDGRASLAEALLLGRRGLLLSCVPVGGFQLVVVPCRVAQAGCQGRSSRIQRNQKRKICPVPIVKQGPTRKPR